RTRALATGTWSCRRRRTARRGSRSASQRVLGARIGDEDEEVVAEDRALELLVERAVGIEVGAERAQIEERVRGRLPGREAVAEERVGRVLVAQVERGRLVRAGAGRDQLLAGDAEDQDVDRVDVVRVGGLGDEVAELRRVQRVEPAVQVPGAEL